MRINRRATAEQAHDTVGGHFHRYEVYLYPMTLPRTAGRLYGGPWSGTTPTDGTQLDDDPPNATFNDLSAPLALSSWTTSK